MIFGYSHIIKGAFWEHLIAGPNLVAPTLNNQLLY